MNSDDLDLRSVNWSQGMFLTPDHFLQQERYLDSMFLWILRYALPSHGLIGGGPRVDATERGAARYERTNTTSDASTYAAKYPVESQSTACSSLSCVTPNMKRRTDTTALAAKIKKGTV